MTTKKKKNEEQYSSHCFSGYFNFFFFFLNPLSAKKLSKEKKSKVKVTLFQRTPRLSASPSLITFQFQSLVVSLSEICMNVFSCYIYTTCGTKG